MIGRAADSRFGRGSFTAIPSASGNYRAGVSQQTRNCLKTSSPPAIFAGSSDSGRYTAPSMTIRTFASEKRQKRTLDSEKNRAFRIELLKG
jgi:hypothetical protein